MLQMVSNSFNVFKVIWDKVEFNLLLLMFSQIQFDILYSSRPNFKLSLSQTAQVKAANTFSNTFETTWFFTNFECLVIYLILSTQEVFLKILMWNQFSFSIKI